MNGNIFTPQANGFYPYQYNAAMPNMVRPDLAAYVMPQTQQPAYIKGRPVASLEEARVAQIDLDGSTFIFPDLGNKRIYTKRINADGTATLQSYVLADTPEEPQPVAYVTKEEFSSLKTTLDEVLFKLSGKQETAPPQKLNF